MAFADAVLSHLIYYAAIPITLIIIYRFIRSRPHQFEFVYIYTTIILKDMMTTLAPIKNEIFAQLSKQESLTDELRKENSLRILEIGPGPGTNFAYYPKNCRLVCYDPNPYFRDVLMDQRKKFPDLNLERFVLSGAEELVGTEDESVDAVVSSCALCSVGDVEAVFKEIRRVLVPGGKFYFVEHTNSLQIPCNPAWKTLFLGCQISGDVEFLVKNAGFANLQIKQCPTVSNNFVFRMFVNRAVAGVAQK